MGSIVLLDEATINKIAAGEVVDRPSSIVKELVENSIDANANKITIEIKNGGISYIKITDNGTGFAADDVSIAFERHATSKIRREEDLLKVKSMGFRGEALASITAISKVTLVSKNINESIGTKAIVEGGNIIDISEYAAATGTIIEIRDVFYNVPARFKFLKKDFTEAGYIEDVITRLALSNPEVSFKLISNNKQILLTRGKGDIKDTVYDIFGKEIYQNLINIDYEYESMKVTGVIGRPVISRSTRTQQFTYINSRYVKDKVISSAIDRACLQKYAIGKFAFCIINLNINPRHVDVNVHPAKLEVKFDDEGAVFEAVYHSIKNALEQDAIKTNPFSIIREEKEEKNENLVISNNVVEKVDKKPLTLEQEIKKVEKNEREIKKNINLNNENIKTSLFKPYVAEDTQSTIYNIVSSDVVEKDEVSLNNKEELLNTNLEVGVIDDNTIKEEKSNKEPLYYKYVGQVFDTYIIIQIDKKMYIIDQHAAHERLLYEKIKKDYFSKKSNSQLLLIPILINLTQKELDIVKENKELFYNTGFEMESFGTNTIKISGVPNIGYDIDFKGVFLDIVDEISTGSKTHSKEKEERFIATLACKAAVKGNMNLSYAEQITLLDEMVKLDNPFNCPHGRPTAIEMDKYEIERKFLRK